MLPLVGVIATSFANLLTFLALPDLHHHHEPKEVAFFFFLQEETVAHWQEAAEAVMGPVRHVGAGLREAMPWRAGFFLLMLAPVFGAATITCLVMVFRWRPWLEKAIAVLFALVSLPVVAYACFVTWYALMKTHYLC